MSERDSETYMQIFKLVTNLVQKPDLLIYLKASVPTLVRQIHKRGRDYEMNIDEAYLERLNRKYNHWIEDLYEGPILVVDKDNEDFVADASIFERICAEIDKRDVQKRLF